MENGSSQEDDDRPSNTRIFAGSILFATVIVAGTLGLAWFLYDWMSRLF